MPSISLYCGGTETNLAKFFANSWVNRLTEPHRSEHPLTDLQIKLNILLRHLPSRAFAAACVNKGVIWPPPSLTVYIMDKVPGITYIGASSTTHRSSEREPAFLCLGETREHRIVQRAVTECSWSRTGSIASPVNSAAVRSH